MNRVPYPGINARIIGPFLLVIILIAGIGVFTVTRLVAGSIQERFSNQLADSASAASNSVVDIERQQLATLRLMIFTENVPDAVVNKDSKSLNLWFGPIAANAAVDDVIVFDGSGQGLLQLQRVETDSGAQYNSVTPPPHIDWPGVQNVLAADADRLGDKFADVVGQVPGVMLYISAPVVDSTGRTVGGVSIGLTAAHMARRVSAQALSAVTLLGNQGELLASTFQVAPDILALSPDHAANLLSQVDNTSPLEAVAIDGTSYQVLYAPLQVRSQRIGLLAVALPSNFIVERSSTSRDVLGVLFSLMFVGVALLGVATARTITRPIARLVSTTRAIREGDLSRRVELRTPDELGELGTSFDHMTEQLVQRNVEINSMYIAQLQETARRDAVLSSISDAVIVQDPNGQVILRNPTAEQLIRAVAKNSASLREFVALCQRPTELAQPRTVTFANHVFSVLATPVCLPTGAVLGHVLVFRDITAIAEAERLKDDLIRQMSHELRTPLTAALGYVNLVKTLDRTNLSEQSGVFMGNAADNLAVLERMVNQVIDVSALISNQFTLNFQAFNLAQLLGDEVARWSPIMRKRDLSLALFVSRKKLQIEGDARWLSQVIDHLLRNAYSYTLPGGTIEVHAQIQSDFADVWVRDNGVGIGPDEIDRVFERMYRGSSSAAGPTDSRGLGLGLYISKWIVEAHHGNINLQSELNAGTMVTLELPVRQRGR